MTDPLWELEAATEHYVITQDPTSFFDEVTSRLEDMDLDKYQVKLFVKVPGSGSWNEVTAARVEFRRKPAPKSKTDWTVVASKVPPIIPISNDTH